ncbi:maleylpyruvate isomerase family mycothiol-dependent enzyme [Arthrobacter tumbae]|uniref:maleylpyruvate isomerase family mycothiol-dependent enzyme n=1 Tax=Arthrobacter tumbae TaxID=163874 RepID=UPI00195E0658|nr:maleylpyruvate isomerase family mycothiol-dependent enzyme [Arthrobacter tumbae]MBM7782635.1 uncharacterized protein (TIGR03083 family) [Arthrobacter tumbae]
MSSRKWTGVWPAVHEERRALIEDLAGMSEEQWAMPSWCPGWDVNDVVAHLVDSAKTTRVSFVRRLVSARFDFDRDNAAGVARERRATPTDTLAEFRRVLNETKTPPAAPATRLVEAIIHGEDIRRPLGLKREYPIEHVATALMYQLRTTVSMGGGKQRAAASRIVATDSDVDFGTGAEVRGSTLSLLLAVSGRPVDRAEFSGEGAAAFIQ